MAKQKKVNRFTTYLPPKYAERILKDADDRLVSESTIAREIIIKHYRSQERG